ncbi:MAG: LysM peptidoglycan-binding domain-containing protein, partial [Planctomycetes bacterium]|nr:LysM peptidoglycan-binding domain-containing protein [Planctomycetota bacterium]
MGRWIVGLLAVLGSLQAVAGEAKLQLLLPLGRTAYQTNETIDLAVVRSSAEALAAGNLVLSVSSTNGSKMSFTFPVPAVPVAGKDARATEHLHLNAWLLRPGNYTVEAACDGAAASAGIEVYSHVRKSDFKLLVWGRAQKEQKLVEGEESIGYNLIYGHYTNDDDANYIRAGCDIMPNCVMSGGHQMDLRQECDWSDPYVARGGTARVVQRALQMRTRPNVPGIHFYDEPGLTWWEWPPSVRRYKVRAGDSYVTIAKAYGVDADTLMRRNRAPGAKEPVTLAPGMEVTIPGVGTPHGIPAQVRAYQSAFGREWLPHDKVDPANPDHVRQWKQWAFWKLGFMDAAWKEAQFGVNYVEPGYLTATQSQYGWSAFTDGYYFNVVRSLPIISGHGGYHDYGPGYFNHSYDVE